MKTPTDISPRQFTANLHAKADGEKQYLQHIDFQHLFRCKNTPSFTGKEKDSETGFYYFGARYYDPSLSGLFLGVDPMADKYPSISPYAYCAWNPVKLVDPDGKEWDKPEDKEKAQKMENAVKNRISDILKVIQSKRKQIDRITNNEKMKASKKDKKLSTLNNELSDLEYQKELLEDFIVGLHDLGDDQDKRYSFNPSEGDVQVNTFQEVNGVIPINYPSRRMFPPLPVATDVPSVARRDGCSLRCGGFAIRRCLI